MGVIYSTNFLVALSILLLKNCDTVDTIVPDDSVWHFRLAAWSYNGIRTLHSQFPFIPCVNVTPCDICHFGNIDYIVLLVLSLVHRVC